MSGTSERRCNQAPRRLVAAGNLAALLASDPDRFSAEYRQQVVRAWDAALHSVRQLQTGDTNHG